MGSTNTIFVQAGFGLKHCEMQHIKHINVIIHTNQEHNLGFDLYDQTKMEIIERFLYNQVFIYRLKGLIFPVLMKIKIYSSILTIDELEFSKCWHGYLKLR